MIQEIKVFTPIKRVPIVVGKLQNGDRIPFGPYTLPQIAVAVVLMLGTAVCAMNLPGNPAFIFAIGVILTVLTVLVVGRVPYTGIRISSRAFWLGRLVCYRKPVSASGIPLETDSIRHTILIEPSVVLLLSADDVAVSSANGAGPVDGNGHRTEFAG
ncbi:hypothetical protein [Nocardia colli]|uniref:hypothetical protein n=1 Tax=Nocardia colli TaxID=2545717 RepID=UPI00168D6AB3|nr:hypothetical protein [Nocardia colli]